MSEFKDLKKHTRKAINWFAAEYNYLETLKNGLEDIKKQKDISKEKKAYRRVRRALLYVRRAERRSEQALAVGSNRVTTESPAELAIGF